MFFGLSNSPASFQVFANKLFGPLQQKYGKWFRNYMDDEQIGTYLGEKELHKQIIKDFLKICQENSLHLKLSKSVFIAPEIVFLSMHISSQGVSINPSKTAGITEWPRTLKNHKEVCSFLGVVGYLHTFIPNFAHIAKPLTDLTKNDTTFKWAMEQQEAQEKLITAVTLAPILQPLDTMKQFELEVDASHFASGAILFQCDPTNQKLVKPVGFISHTFLETERNWPIYEQEYFAIIHGLQSWSHLLRGTEEPVIVWTDHKNLEYYRDPHKVSPKVI
jgi:hypothetical protein